MALRFLARGDVGTYRELIEPCEELSQWIFQEPTQFYKSGLAFIAWMRGEQSNPMLLNHEERNRDFAYYQHIAGSEVGLIRDPNAACARFQMFEDYVKQTEMYS